MASSPPLTFSQLEQTWMDASVNTQYHTDGWARLMSAIALAESAGRPYATNPNDNYGTQTSWGLWQISLGNHNEPSPDWYNPVDNAKLAIGKLQTQGLDAWGTYTSSAYQQYMQGAGPSQAQLSADTSKSGGGGGGGNNPFWIITAPIKGLENLGGWVVGTGGSGVQGQGVLGDILEVLKGIMLTFSKIGQMWAMLMNPALWLRIGAFIVGIVAIIGAFKMFGTSLRAPEIAL